MHNNNIMNKAIELIQAEIKKLEDANPKETSWNDIGIIQGLEKSIELIKASEATKAENPVWGQEDCEDEDDGLQFPECPYCGAFGGANCDLHCPHNDSPYAQLVRVGHD